MKIIFLITILAAIAFAFGGGGGYATTPTPTVTPIPTITPTATPTPMPTWDSIKVSCTQTNIHERAVCLANLKPQDWITNYPMYIECQKYYKTDLPAFQACQEVAEKANECRMRTTAKGRTICINDALKILNPNEKAIWLRLFSLYYLEYLMQNSKVSHATIINYIQIVETQKMKIIKGVNTTAYNKIVNDLRNSYIKLTKKTK
ncbi:Uncharacterised protein [uncultured archaeon]|nr:Uncharacterised protein [uncultured archaeon]